MTTYVEKNESVAVGAPYRLPAENGAVVTIIINKDFARPKGVFSFKVEGH